MSRGRVSVRTGIHRLPELRERHHRADRRGSNAWPKRPVLGGHAVLAVGYDDSEQRFIVRNSWGTGWGMEGYFTMPYLYLTERGLSSDFWTIRTVS